MSAVSFPVWVVDGKGVEFLCATAAELENLKNQGYKLKPEPKLEPVKPEPVKPAVKPAGDK